MDFALDPLLKLTGATLPDGNKELTPEFAPAPGLAAGRMIAPGEIDLCTDRGKAKSC